MPRFDPALQREYEEHYASVNIWKNRYASQYRPGAVLNGSSLCSDNEFERSEWYADYLRRANVFYSMGAVLFRDELSSGTLTVLRSKQQGVFDGEERILQVLCPHLQRALTIHRRIGGAAAGYAALNAVPFGVILLDTKIRVLFANEAATKVCDNNDGLAVRFGRVVAASLEKRKLLANMLSRAALFAIDPAGAADDYISITRPSGKKPYQLFVTPVRVPFGFDPYSAAVLICIGETMAGAVAPGALAKLFGFTRQESRLASMLSEGQELAGAAAKLNITYETARKHLQSILRKSGSHRQSELVRLIPGGVARITSS